MKENLFKIINHYGLSPQLKYFQSEVFELNEAIITFENEPLNFLGAANKNHIKEEIGDVLCMLRQFQYYYGFTDEEIDDIVKYKVYRQLERMRNNESN